MDKKSAMEKNQKIGEDFEKEDQAEKNMEQRHPAFDDLYKGRCYVVKDRADSYQLKHLPKVSTKETNKQFKTGDKVKNQYGKLLTVLAQIGKMVIVKEETGNYHPANLTIIERAVDVFQM